jgi:predicted nucleic acid-binding Zn ribbon protein
MAAANLEASHEQRRRVRRSALLWGLIAAAFYVAFIVLAVVRASK